MTSDRRRSLPSVNSLLESEVVRAATRDAPAPAVVEAVRAVLQAAREGDLESTSSSPEWAEAVLRELRRSRAPTLRRVINATGVVLHTNLGRAPLAPAAVAAMNEVASGYSALEYDIESGERGSRHHHCVRAIRDLTGAADAMVVNNGAAALMLALNTVASGRPVVISRGELVEIGGSFRVPDVMARSGALLVEVGTTNRTHALDYRAAITGETAAIVKVHRSNFRQSGFVAEVDVADLTRIAAERSIPLIHDLGSGLLASLEEFGLPHEPTARESLAAGATIVVMSGDKLLGGPQAGIVAGDADLVAAMRHNPLARALRVDKLTTAALAATLDLWRDPATAVREIPALSMICATRDELQSRAENLAVRLSARGVSADMIGTDGAVGAGAYPTHPLPSVALRLAGAASRIESALRAGEPPVVCLVRDGAVLLDVRTILPSEEHDLVVAVEAAVRATDS